MGMTNNELDKLEHRISILRRKRLASMITNCASFLLGGITHNINETLTGTMAVIWFVSGITACVYSVKLRALIKYINTAKLNLYNLDRYKAYIEQIKQERDEHIEYLNNNNKVYSTVTGICKLTR